MWTLTSKINGQVFYLLPEKEKYLVGRSNADLIIKDDSSISRYHACLLPAEDHVSVTDVGSKYGTFCNFNIENKVHMVKNVAIKLKNGERVQFGQMGNEWVLSKLNISTMVSSLNAEQRTAVQQNLDSLKGQIIDSWSESCTHLTMSKITVTIKVLFALVANIPIVSTNYWNVYLKELRAGHPPPNACDFLPEIGEAFLNKDNVVFSIIEMRKSVFLGKIFVFMSKRHYDMYQPIITRAGGECRDLNNGVPKSLLIKKNVIVIQHNSTSVSQSSQAIDNISHYIKSNGRRLVPDCEIGLAIIYNSTEKYCNPEYAIAADLVPDTPLSTTNKTIIAPRTQVHEVIAPKSQSDKIIAQRTQFDDFGTLSVEIPESAPIETEKYMVASTPLNLFGDDDVVQSSAHHEKSTSGGVKRKRSNSIELSSKKLHKIVEDDIQSVDYPSLSPPNVQQVDRSIIIPETDQQGEKPMGNVEKQFSQIDLSGFIDKNTIARMQRKVQPEDSRREEEEAKNKRQRFTFSSDENSDDEIMVTWNHPKRAKIDAVKPNTNNYNKEKLPKVSAVHGSTSKQPQLKHSNKPMTNVQKAKKATTLVKQPQKDIVFPSKFSSTDWLSSTNIKREDISTDNDFDEKLDKTKIQWIDSIKEAFEVRIKVMDLLTRTFEDTSINDQSKTNEKNFKAFVKKRNYKPQSIIIRTQPVVVMNV